MPSKVMIIILIRAHTQD